MHRTRIASRTGAGRCRTMLMAARPFRHALGLVPAPLRRFARQLYQAGWRLTEHDGLTVAGYMAFAAFTSLFPFLIFLAALASVLGTRETADETVEGMFLFLPADVARTLAPAVHEVMAGHHGGLLTFGVLATLWTASSGVEALRDALDRAYEVKDLAAALVAAPAEHGGGGRRRAGPVRGLAGGDPGAGALAPGRVLRPPQRGGGAVLDGRPLRPQHRRARRWACWRSTAGCRTTTCRRGPCCRGCCSRSGCGWSGASLFSLYLGTVADYSVIYGSLGGVVITLLFFYLTGALFILGAEYNAVRLKDTARDAAPASARPSLTVAAAGRTPGRSSANRKRRSRGTVDAPAGPEPHLQLGRSARGPLPSPEGQEVRGVLLWLVGIPIPVIVLLYLFNVL